MALESGSYIDSLNTNNPVATDPLAQADDHIRLIKATIKASFPNITGAVTLTQTEINALKTSLSAASGTRMLFQNSSSPVGWTKSVDSGFNNAALRVVTGSVGSTTDKSGGSVAFQNVFTSQTPAGTVSTNFTGTSASTVLSVDQIPSHNHSFTEEFSKEDNNFSPGSQRPLRENSVDLGDYTITTANTGGGQGHTHGFSVTGGSTFAGSSMNFDVKYVDIIIAQKD